MCKINAHDKRVKKTMRGAIYLQKLSRLPSRGIKVRKLSTHSIVLMLKEFELGFQTFNASRLESTREWCQVLTKTISIATPSDSGQKVIDAFHCIILKEFDRSF